MSKKTCACQFLFKPEETVYLFIISSRKLPYIQLSFHLYVPCPPPVNASASKNAHSSASFHKSCIPNFDIYLCIIYACDSRIPLYEDQRHFSVSFNTVFKQENSFLFVCGGYRNIINVSYSKKTWFLYLFLFHDLSSRTPERHRSGTPAKFANV